LPQDPARTIAAPVFIQISQFGQIMKIVVFALAVIQIVIGLLFIIDAPSTQRLILGTISFGLGLMIGQLDSIRFNRN